MTELVILILAPGIRAGCLPFGEARGEGFALSEIPHPSRGLLLNAKVRFFRQSVTRCPLPECIPAEVVVSRTLLEAPRDTSVSSTERAERFGVSRFGGNIAKRTRTAPGARPVQ